MLYIKAAKSKEEASGEEPTGKWVGGRRAGKEKEPSHWLCFWNETRCLSPPCHRGHGHDVIDFTPCKEAFKKKPGWF